MFAMTNGVVEEKDLVAIEVRVEGFRERNRRFCATRVIAFLLCM